MDGSINTVKFLLEAGADPNIFDEVSLCRSVWLLYSCFEVQLLGLLYTLIAED
jgi:hypothetical protein